MEKELKTAIDEVYKDYANKRVINQFEFDQQVDGEVVKEILKNMFTLVYPGYYMQKNFKMYNLETQYNSVMEDVVYRLRQQVSIALYQKAENKSKTKEEVDLLSKNIVVNFVKQIPSIRASLEDDIDAFYEGDPASFNKNEIILCYPGLYAVTTYRIAHELYKLGVPLIPRMMSEFAHSKTGIDIHPGTTIGKHFFIDHGTGIVIGETTIIGDNVKIYQGVTLGALSTRGGQSLRGKKRHPTIEDNVTIYSNASILGGDTIIGENSVIGGNTFITSSVPKNTKVLLKDPEEQHIYTKGE